jgi:hypothetical protein
MEKEEGNVMRHAEAIQRVKTDDMELNLNSISKKKVDLSLFLQKEKNTRRYPILPSISQKKRRQTPAPFGKRSSNLAHFHWNHGDFSIILHHTRGEKEKKRKEKKRRTGTGTGTGRERERERERQQGGGDVSLSSSRRHPSYGGGHATR